MIMGVAIIEYRRNRYPTYLYLLCATIFYIIQAILGALVANVPAKVESREQALFNFLEITLPLSVTIISLLGAAYFLVLFFQAFKSDRILTKKNFSLSLLFTILITGLLITTIILQANIPELKNKTNDEILDVIFVPLLILGLFILISILFLIWLISETFYTIHHRIHATTNPVVQLELRKMRYAFIGIFLGVLAGAILHNLTGIITGGLLTFLSFGYLVYLYFSGGAYLLQSDDLKRLIIISSELGLPVYSYNFLTTEGQERKLPFEDQEILFSGALKAISTLFGEFTGQIDQNIKELHLDNIIVMGNRIDKEISIILLTERSTRFFREGLDKLTKQLATFFAGIDLDPNVSISKHYINNLNKLVEDNFGLGGFSN